MKKFYYFSEKSLKFLEIKHFKGKAIAIFTISLIVLSAFFAFAFYFISNLSNGEKELAKLKKENGQLKEKILSLSQNFQKLENELNSISDLSNNLRLAANLTPLTDADRKVGVGGSSFISELYNELGSDVVEAINTADRITKRFDFEKFQFEEIANKLKQNQLLYESIPAIKPCEGEYSIDSYGMRLHPILNIYKMHTGIDILNDVGTAVKSSGKGKVVFVGTRGGYGLTVEIDHGFGYKTIYAHLSSTNVKEGQIVNRGQVIAKSGNSGLSSGPHLHYEVLHNGQNYNPADFFFDEFSYFETNSK